MRISKYMILATFLIPFIYMFFSPVDLGWFRYLLLFLILVLGFWLSITDSRRRPLYIIIQLLSVALIGVFTSPWSLCMGFYPAIVMGMLPSYRHINRMVGVMAVSSAAAACLFYVLSGTSWRFEWAPVVIGLMLIPYVSKVWRRSFEMSIQLRQANHEIARLIKNEERQRIARDLHDTLGHTLSMITLKSELVERLIPLHPEEAMEEVRDVQQISRSALLQMRSLVSDMQSIDIAEELRRAEQIFRSANIEFIQDIKMDPGHEAQIIRNILGMCLRECVTNVVKHSSAHKCTVRLHETPENYRLSVEDDGIGITREAGNFEQFGNGLLGMKERLLLIEGRLEFNSDEASGTKVNILVPKIGKPAMTEE